MLGSNGGRIEDARVSAPSGGRLPESPYEARWGSHGAGRDGMIAACAGTTAQAEHDLLQEPKKLCLNNKTND
jgi:hypothetical protein